MTQPVKDIVLGLLMAIVMAGLALYVVSCGKMDITKPDVTGISSNKGIQIDADVAQVVNNSISNAKWDIYQVLVAGYVVHYILSLLDSWIWRRKVIGAVERRGEA